MWPDRVSNPGPLTYESGALPTALRGPAINGGMAVIYMYYTKFAKGQFYNVMSALPSQTYFQNFCHIKVGN